MGFLTEADVQAINRRLTEELAPGLFDLVLYCPYHPRGRVAAYRRDAACRKPRPGMAFEARDRLGLDLGASLMVGDRDVDRDFAREAGIPSFYWAHDFFRAPRDSGGEPAPMG
jgi:histidinol phosphatase-like enzyme